MDKDIYIYTFISYIYENCDLEKVTPLKYGRLKGPCQDSDASSDQKNDPNRSASCAKASKSPAARLISERVVEALEDNPLASFVGKLSGFLAWIHSRKTNSPHLQMMVGGQGLCEF